MTTLPERLTEKHMQALWYRFEEIFGESIMRTHAGSIKFWHSELNRREITPEKIAIGVQATIDLALTFPPSLGQFLILCKPRRINAAMYQEQPKLEPPPVKDREKIAKELKALINKLKNS